LPRRLVILLSTRIEEKYVLHIGPDRLLLNICSCSVKYVPSQYDVRRRECAQLLHCETHDVTNKARIVEQRFIVEKVWRQTPRCSVIARIANNNAPIFDLGVVELMIHIMITQAGILKLYTVYSLFMTAIRHHYTVIKPYTGCLGSVSKEKHKEVYNPC